MTLKEFSESRGIDYSTLMQWLWRHLVLRVSCFWRKQRRRGRVYYVDHRLYDSRSDGSSNSMGVPLVFSQKTCGCSGIGRFYFLFFYFGLMVYFACRQQLHAKRDDRGSVLYVRYGDRGNSSFYHSVSKEKISLIKQYKKSRGGSSASFSLVVYYLFLLFTLGIIKLLSEGVALFPAFTSTGTTSPFFSIKNSISCSLSGL